MQHVPKKVDQKTDWVVGECRIDVRREIHGGHAANIAIAEVRVGVRKGRARYVESGTIPNNVSPPV
jgi:hypothetical protein